MNDADAQYRARLLRRKRDPGPGSLAVEKGQIVCGFGRNGAGKSVFGGTLREFDADPDLARKSLMVVQQASPAAPA